jgi:hypothetical protein
MMQANIANFVRQEVRVSKRKPLLPILETVSNYLDAITDRRRRGCGGSMLTSHCALRRSGAVWVWGIR